MASVDLTVYPDCATFAEDWQVLGYSATETDQYWALLAELGADEVLLHIPEWLADDKIGFVDGTPPTAFVAQIDRVTENAILVPDAVASRPLSQLAHRIHSLEESIARLQAQDDTDPDRIAWLERRLKTKRTEFEQRDDLPSLTDAWLPRSQLEFIGRRASTD